MNDIRIPIKEVIRINDDVVVNNINMPFLVQKYADLSNLSLNEFHIAADDAHCLFGLYYKIMPISEVPGGMADYQGTGKVIKCINAFDKRDPGLDMEKDIKARGFFAHDDFATTALYVSPQMIVKDGKLMADLYVEPAEECYDFNRFSMAQKLRRGIAVLAYLDYVETRLKKERHVIKKLMPTPEQIDALDKAGKNFISAPVIIRGMSVRYIYEQHDPRKYERHCEAWGVRGHYRHYKSGKKIYIQPHIKGRGRVKDTEYIFEEAD